LFKPKATSYENTKQQNSKKIKTNEGNRDSFKQRTTVENKRWGSR